VTSKLTCAYYVHICRQRRESPLCLITVAFGLCILMLKVYQCLQYIDRWWVTITDKASLTTADPETHHRTICKFLNNYIGDSLYTDGPSVLQDWKEVQG
jgi:hypothetical protein